MVIVNLVKDAYQELKKVQWPSKDQAMRLTGYVIGVSLLVGLFITGVDYIFKQLLVNIIG